MDDAGYAYVIGEARSAAPIIPTANALYPARDSNCYDGMVMKIDTNTPNNFTFAYASYLGGSGPDSLSGLAIGPDGALYITGMTGSPDFPTTAGPYSQYQCSAIACTSAFLVKLNLTLPQLVFGNVFDMLADGQRVVVLPGDLPVVLGSPQLFQDVNPIPGTGQYNSPVIVFSTDGTSVVFASYLLPSAISNSNYHIIATNGSGKLYVAGTARDDLLGSQGAYQQNLAGNSDGLIASISGIATNSPPTVDLGPAITLAPTDPNGLLFTLDCTNTLPCIISDPEGNPLVSYRWIGPNGFTDFSTSGPPVSSVQLPLGSNQISLIVTDNQGAVGVGQLTVNVVNQPPYINSISPDFTVLATSPAGAYVSISVDASDPENDPLSYAWSGPGSGFVPDFPFQDVLLPIGVNLISVTVTDSFGGSATATVTITVLGVNTGTGPQTVGLFDDNQPHASFSSYTPGNPLGGHLITLTFANVQAPGLSWFRSRFDLVPPPPALMQAGSPPWYYDIGTTAVHSGNVDVCVAIRGMSFANPPAIQLYQLQGGGWAALTFTLMPNVRICASTPSLGTFAIFYPQVPETAISTIAGTGIAAYSTASGPATSIPLIHTTNGVFDRTRNYLYFADPLHVRRLNLNTGILAIVVGNGFFPGQIDGPGGNPQDDVLEGVDPLSTPGSASGFALDAVGNLYYSGASCRVRKVDFTANTVNTVAGNGTCGFSGDGGQALQASLSTSVWGSLAMDNFGNLFIADYFNHRIRRVDALGVITTVAGNGAQHIPTPGVAATQSAVSAPDGIAFDAQGYLLVALLFNGVVRISPGADSQINGGADELLSIVVGAPLTAGVSHSSWLPFGGDGGAATQASVIAGEMVVASDGALILTDIVENRIRRVSPGADGIVTGAPDEMITTIAGYSYFFTGAGIFNGDTYATMATLAHPSDAFEDQQGRIIVIDSINNRIRRFGLSPFLATVQPPASPDLSVDVTAFPDPVNTGSNLVLSVTLVNGGPGDATGVRLEYQLAASVNFVSASPSQGTCTTPAVGSSGTVICDLGTMPVSTTPIVSMASVNIVVTPTTAGPLASVFSVGSNEPDANWVDNTKTVNVTVAQGPAVIGPILETIRVTDDPQPLPSAMIPPILETIRVTDGPPVVIPQDNTPPVVTAPATLVVAATEPTGARGNVSPALSSFLLSGTATDAEDPNPQRLPTQVNGSDADDTTLFPVGATTVTFRFRDVSNNIGAATTLVIVDPPIGGAVSLGGTPVTPTDPYNTPMPLEITFAGVTQPGLVTAAPVVNPPAAPAGFQISGTVFDIATTAIFTPPIEVCFSGSGFTARDRILHFSRGFWVDVTSLVTATKICGTVNSLSPFAVAAPVNQAPSANAGLDQTVEATSTAGASVTLNGSGSDPDGDVLAFAWSGPCGSSSTAAATFTCPLGSNTMTLAVSDGRGGGASASVTIIVLDTTPPLVTPPASITVSATEAGGARGSARPGLAAYLAGGSAVDLVDPAPARLAPLVGGAVVDNNTLFSLGTTSVTFQFRDAGGNVGSATSTVTVVLGTPRINGAIAAKGRDSSGNFYVDLRLTNSGTGNAQNVRLTALTLRTLAGTGSVSYNASLSGALPLSVGNLATGASTTLRLYLTVPATVTRFSITENGALQNVVGTNGSFSIAQSVMP